MKKQSSKARRSRKVREKMKENATRMRMSVFRSNKHIYVQVIDDTAAHTIASISDLNLENKKKETKTQRAYQTGEYIGKSALKLKVKSVVFDRGPYKYAGRVRALAEGVVASGVKI